MKRGKEEDTLPSDESESKKNVSGHTTSSSLPSSSTPVEPLPSGSIIPQFYFQGGRPPSDEMREECLAKIDDCFRDHPDGLKKDEFRSVTKEVCGLPSFFSSVLFDKVDNQNSGTVTRDRFVDYWIGDNMLTKDVATRIFLVLKQQTNQNYILQEDLLPVLNEVVNNHPGLHFIRNFADVKENYVQTVLYRIFYFVNRYESGLLTLGDLKRGKLIAVMRQVDEERDINEVRRCFSYRHSQVIYNYFLELDTDGDLALSKVDICNYNGRCLTETIVKRIFEQPRRFTSGIARMMCYEDFVYFMLSVEDPSSEPAIDYWFKCIDLGGNGRLTKHDFSHFYPEQRRRMDIWRQPRLSFENMFARIHDMIAPKNKWYITLRDLKACKLAGRVFDMIFNLPRHACSEKDRDPVISMEEHDDLEVLTEWDIFADREYMRLCVDDDDDDFDDASTESVKDADGKKDKVTTEDTATSSGVVKSVIDELF